MPLRKPSMALKAALPQDEALSRMNETNLLWPGALGAIRRFMLLSPTGGRRAPAGARGLAMGRPGRSPGLKRQSGWK